MKRPTPRNLLAPLICLGVVLPAGIASAAPSIENERSPAAVAPEPPAPTTFRFGCRVDATHERPAVRCRWQPIKSRRVAAYVVYRAQMRPEQLGREAIARVRQGDRPVVEDRNLRFGTAWVYAVVAVGHSGEPLAVSNLERFLVPAPN